MSAQRVVAAGAVLLALAVVAGWPVYVKPKVDSASPRDPADAIVVLGGEPAAAFYAQRLFEAGDARRLVVSNPYGPPPYGELSSLCPADPASRISCFVPEPSTTRGEAQGIRRLAKENRWDDVIVVVPTFHISRARVIISRCYDGRLRMVAYRAQHALDWPYQYVYQTFGYAKAAILRGC